MAAKLKRALQIVVLILVFGAMLFGSAGRLDWMAGWVLFISYLTGVFFVAVYLRRRDPQLLQERQKPGGEVKAWDRAIMRVYTIMLVFMLMLASADSGRFGWSSMPLYVQVLAYLGFVLAGIMIWWAMANNSYLSSYVRIQDERGHEVASGGPYRYVRHPMYVGVILFMLCVPLALGSWWGLLPAAAIMGLYILRTALEDHTLQTELVGYKAYAQQVRYRLLPGVW